MAFWAIFRSFVQILALLDCWFSLGLLDPKSMKTCCVLGSFAKPLGQEGYTACPKAPRAQLEGISTPKNIVMSANIETLHTPFCPPSARLAGVYRAPFRWQAQYFQSLTIKFVGRRSTSQPFV